MTWCYAYWDDQHVSVRVHGAHYSRVAWSDAQLGWTIPETNLAGTHAVAHVDRGAVKDLGLLHWSVPQVEQAQPVQVHITLESADGSTLARNSLDVLVLSSRARQPAFKEPLAAIGRGDLEQSMGLLGYRTTSQLTPNTNVAVTNYPNTDLLRWVRAGGDLLFLSCNGPSPFFWTQQRSGAYAGDWTTSFSWLRPEIHPRLTITNPLSLPFLHVMPTHTILGLPVSDPTVQADFLAGMVSGWVRQPAIHTVQFRYGRGRVIMTTFALDAVFAGLADVCGHLDLATHPKTRAPRA